MAWSSARLNPVRSSGGPELLTKLAYAERLTAALALLLLRQRDAVGLVRFDERVRTAIPPRARTGQWRRIVASLDDPGAGLASSVPEALAQAARLISRRGMVVLISDLLMDLPEVERSVRGLRAAGHDITVLHIMDPSERDLTISAEALFVDPESALEVPASTSDVRTAYRRTVDQVLAEWRTAFAGAGVGYEIITTDSPFGVPLRRAFAARQELP
jgi:uncharacterized protein (DUF58 family)